MNLHSPCICNMLNDHRHRVSTHLQSINIIIIIIIKTKMNIITQISQGCAVMCPINVLSASIHSKQRKIQQAPQCVQSNTAISWWGGPLSHIFVVRSKASTAVATLQQHSTQIYHSQPAQPCLPTHLCSTVYLEALLKPMYCL